MRGSVVGWLLTSEHNIIDHIKMWTISSLVITQLYNYISNIFHITDETGVRYDPLISFDLNKTYE